MHFEQILLSFFTIILVFCTIDCESGVNELCVNNEFQFSSPGLGSFLSTDDKDLVLSLHNETAMSADEAECKCENGRCEWSCAAWKDGACLKMKQDCVCDPEFGKYDDHTCIYCDCGLGYNCTIDRDSRGDIRQCICPRGFYDYGHECAPFCSDKKPCINGGICKDGKCKCKSGTMGPFCEYIFWCSYECRARLTLDCVYNQKEETYGCLCKNRSLVFDYEEQLCKECPCGEGTCREERHKLRCDCKEGYQEHERKCKRCDCGPGQGCELHWRTGEKSCKCQTGFFEREGTCQPCECGHEEATCKMDNIGRKICICPQGYEDNLGLCTKVKKTVENCTCHPTANCKEKDDGFYCTCEDGYMGQYTRTENVEPEEPCIDIDECDSQLTGKRLCHPINQKCVNFPGSFMCQCETGYKPVDEADEKGNIKCEKYKVSWLPAGLTIGIVLAFIVISVAFIVFLKKRESSRDSSGLELRGSR